MTRAKRSYLIISFFLCVTISFSLCHVSFEAVNQSALQFEPTSCSRNISKGDNAAMHTSIEDGGLLAEDVLSEKMLVPSLRNIGLVFRTQQRAGHFRNSIDSFLTVLFKTTFIPALLSVVMGLCTNNQTPLWQLILQFIQNKDGKKQAAFSV